MSDALQKAIRDEMERQECDPIAYSMDSLTVCAVHDTGEVGGWDDDRDVCSVVADAVTAGWDAAIREAADASKQDRWVTPRHEMGDYSIGYRDGCTDTDASIQRGIRSLLSASSTKEPNNE